MFPTGLLYRVLTKPTTAAAAPHRPKPLRGPSLMVYGLLSISMSEWFFAHPKSIYLRSCGVPETKITEAITVYLDLIEVRLLHDVAIFFHDQSKLTYITAKRSPEVKQIEVFLPVAADDQLTALQYSELFDRLQLQAEDEKLILAVVDTDSTVVYYTLQRGLPPPGTLSGSDMSIIQAAHVHTETQLRRAKRRR